MFRPLLSYKKQAFYEKHSIIYLDSLYHSGIYKVFAVVNLVKGEWDPSTAIFASDADFLAFYNGPHVKTTSKKILVNGRFVRRRQAALKSSSAKVPLQWATGAVRLFCQANPAKRGLAYWPENRTGGPRCQGNRG